MILGRKAQHPNEIPLKGHDSLTTDFREIARFWVSQERSFVLVAPGVVSSPYLLGSLIVESLHTAAAGYAAMDGYSAEWALAELWRGFDEERARIGGAEEPEEGHA
ncbi:hypothetical protein FJQ54_07565 [Sandaracinobacter neustonicus]|uniref:Uncharacterized protein n=1 Tax=Sandaracinobacter neustonicus TaxID=1715348 RepID=A0A501XM42_9SPHN|nr:hypothetical protein [Sandaracinobacter neustonicus]TPE61752.1 hypothetical protein FJQ54_07565 [Sandaracinobacter neustonicus]